MAVRFRPGGAYPFFGLPLADLTDRFVEPRRPVGPRRVAALLDRARDSDGRSRARGRDLARAHDRAAAFQPDRLTASAVGAIVQVGRLRAHRRAGGARRRHDAAAAAAVCRTRRRRPEDALAHPAISAHAADARVNRRRRSAEWVRIAVECGYADQSHLIHDYAAFAGATPASLIAAESELSAYFTAPQRLAALFGARR